MIPQGQEDVVRAVGRWMSRKDKVQIQQTWMYPLLPVKHSHECFGTQSMSNPRKTWGSKIGFCGFGIWVCSGALNRERRWIQIFGTMSKQLIMLICKAYMCNPLSPKQWLKGREVAAPTWCVYANLMKFKWDTVWNEECLLEYLIRCSGGKIRRLVDYSACFCSLYPRSNWFFSAIWIINFELWRYNQRLRLALGSYFLNQIIRWLKPMGCQKIAV